MLAELICAMRVVAVDPAARRLGYVRELAALEVRHRRLHSVWSEHVAATRAALAGMASQNSNRKGVAIVLGAGLVNDVPLDELMRCFGETWLLDVAFSPATLRAAKQSGRRIRCVPIDFSGVLAQLLARPQDAVRQDPPLRLPLALPRGLCWIASTNCLTQLPILPATWLLRCGVDEATIEAFSRKLILGHLHQLSAPGMPVGLIAELGDERFSSEGMTIATTDYRELFAPFLISRGAQSTGSWKWLVHPIGELPKGQSETRTVGAWQWGPEAVR